MNLVVVVWGEDICLEGTIIVCKAPLTLFAHAYTHTHTHTHKYNYICINCIFVGPHVAYHLASQSVWGGGISRGEPARDELNEKKKKKKKKMMMMMMKRGVNKREKRIN
jgi:hypothetical protein